MERFIIHLNIADFAVAVERGMDCRLGGRPVIIAPSGAVRAAVYDMSEEAYQTGVRKGMPLDRALRRCRDARVIAPRFERYERAMDALLRQALPCSPLVERGEDDGHLFVDVTGTGRLLGPPMDVAWRLQRRIRKDLGLAPIWSLAPSRLVAKVATRLVKPLGEYAVGAGEEPAFLAPLPLSLLPGLEAADLARLRSLNLNHVHQAAVLNSDQLRVLFGNRAGFFYDTLRGIDPTPVIPAGQAPSRAVAEHIFETDTNDRECLERVVFRLVEQVGRKLRDRRLAARRIGIRVDYSDGVRCIRSAGLRTASANDITLFAQARSVFQLVWQRRVRVRYLRLICDRLTFPPAQPSLFAEERQEREKREALVAALDAVRDRFGGDAVRWGRAA
jgi:DNA polymerase-4